MYKTFNSNMYISTNSYNAYIHTVLPYTNINFSLHCPHSYKHFSCSQHCIRCGCRVNKKSAKFI